jgi:hypothetical protein
MSKAASSFRRPESASQNTLFEGPFQGVSKASFCSQKHIKNQYFSGLFFA